MQKKLIIRDNHVTAKSTTHDELPSARTRTPNQITASIKLKRQAIVVSEQDVRQEPLIELLINKEQAVVVVVVAR